jgi:methylmalonyl-CoA epimerase
MDTTTSAPTTTLPTTHSVVLEIDHIAIAVDDIEEAKQWYSEALGFQLLEERETTGSSTSMLSAVMKAGNAIIVLIQGTSPRSQVSQFIDRFGPGVQHIGLRVSDLEKGASRVKRSGGAADTAPIEGEGIRQVFLRRDRGSGVRVELIERNGGNFTDETVNQLFREFERRGLY